MEVCLETTLIRPFCNNISAKSVTICRLAVTMQSWQYTYSSKKSWNSFWHRSPTSSFIWLCPTRLSATSMIKDSVSMYRKYYNKAEMARMVTKLQLEQLFEIFFLKSGAVVSRLSLLQKQIRNGALNSSSLSSNQQTIRHFSLPRKCYEWRSTKKSSSYALQ